MPLAESRCRICGAPKRAFSQICGKLECFRAWRDVIQGKRNSRIAKDKNRWQALVRRNQGVTVAPENEQLTRG